jgi:hypothetical protein
MGMRTPSASLAVSTLALAVALTGTASATGLINGQSIKNHTITANKLAKGAVTARAVRDHAITPAALADGVSVYNTVNAPAGPQGPPGANGVIAIDPSKLVVAVSDDITSVPGSTRVNTQALCPANTYVVGGGNTEVPFSSNSEVVVTGSAPYLDNGAQGWQVTVRNFAGTGQTGAWHVIAYCAPAA